MFTSLSELSRTSSVSVGHLYCGLHYEARTKHIGFLSRERANSAGLTWLAHSRDRAQSQRGSAGCEVNTAVLFTDFDARCVRQKQCVRVVRIFQQLWLYNLAIYQTGRVNVHCVYRTVFREAEARFTWCELV